MILVRGLGGGTGLTGTIYERGEEPPSFKGAPDEAAPYVWICDAFYEVDSGGSTQQVNGQEIQIAFESPMPRGFDTKDTALEAAKEHVHTQFARIGVEDVSIEVMEDVEMQEPSSF
ncbi:MAG: hypothetical protein A07HR60_00097 [uncultured archaeon A07HR60]|nr:MAG: hypothetical protein J07HR59_00709 [Halorubrum sp. J07HR59]ESS12864.1 MAG: hypothetical protein A07HR60_00097 [uncultured archaeon A07HR60]